VRKGNIQSNNFAQIWHESEKVNLNLISACICSSDCRQLV
jgi:hypothetical protein